MARTTVAVAVLTHYLAPVIVALATPLVEGRRVPGAVVAASLAMLGLTLVLAPWDAPLGASTGVGALLGATSAFAYAGSVFAMRRLTIRVGPMRTQGYHALVAAVLLLPFAARVELAGLRPAGLGLVALGSLVPGTLAGLLFLDGLPRVGAARASILAFCEPLVAVALGAIVFDERLSPTAALGAIAILASGVWVSLPRASSVAASAPEVSGAPDRRDEPARGLERERQGRADADA